MKPAPTAPGARNFASARDFVGHERCPDCGGELLTVGGRRWCIQPYHENGCAGFWTRRRDGWRREAWHTPLIPRTEVRP